MGKSFLMLSMEIIVPNHLKAKANAKAKVKLSSACAAALTLGEFTAETFLHKSVKAVTERFQRYTSYDLAYERLHQHHTGLSLGYAALAHIEHSLVVKLTHCSTVRALYVIGIYLQLGLCEHTCLARKADVAVSLL